MSWPKAYQRVVENCSPVVTNSDSQSGLEEIDATPNAQTIIADWMRRKILGTTKRLTENSSGVKREWVGGMGWVYTVDG